MKFQPTNIHPSRMSASARCVCLRAYLHVATVTGPAMATAIAKMITSATTHLLPSLPARLVDGGVGLPVLVFVAFNAERIEHVLRGFDVLHGQDAAGMTPTLRILPRRFEGGGGFF